jgi:hypothetical protein
MLNAVKALKEKKRAFDFAKKSLVAAFISANDTNTSNTGSALFLHTKILI